MKIKGITQLPKGGYRVRVKRGAVWHSGGTHEDPAAAQAALCALLERVGPKAPTRTPAKPMRRQTFGERNIYPCLSGYQVRCTRKGVVHYGGTWRTIVEARAARELIELTYPAGMNKKTKKTKQP